MGKVQVAGNIHTLETHSHKRILSRDKSHSTAGLMDRNDNLCSLLVLEGAFRKPTRCYLYLHHQVLRCHQHLAILGSNGWDCTKEETSLSA